MAIKHLDLAWIGLVDLVSNSTTRSDYLPISRRTFFDSRMIRAVHLINFYLMLKAVTCNSCNKLKVQGPRMIFRPICFQASTPTFLARLCRAPCLTFLPEAAKPANWNFRTNGALSRAVFLISVFLLIAVLPVLFIGVRPTGPRKFCAARC